MFGFYTVKETSNKESYSRYDSKPRKEAETKDVPSKRIQQKKADYETLKERLEKEQKELEKTQKQFLQNQEDMYNSYEDRFIDDPLTHQLNLSYISTTSGYKKGSRYNAVKGSFDAASVDFNKNNNAISFDTLAQNGLKYSSDKGQRLAKSIANHSVGFTGYCSKYASNALANTKLGDERAASAYLMAGKLAENTENFKEVSPDSVDLKKLPAGCYLVYDRGAAGYSSKHGHIEVTLGDGTACSDGRTYNIRKAQNMRIFVPVEKA